MSAPTHIPVLIEETIRALDVQPGGRYIDCTLGAGGHSVAILERSAPGGQLLGIDTDPEAIKIAERKLEPYGHSSLLINDNFANLEAICYKYDFFPVHGILFDLGFSSLQLSSSDRGFSFQHDGPLDMRFSPDQEITAADIVNESSENELIHIMRIYGEEFHSHQITRHIIQERPINSTLHLAQIIEQAVGGRKGKIHPATKTFQALRIAVNKELEHLETALKQAIDLLGFEGKLVVISYHSLEDRIVKQFIQQEAKNCICPPGLPTCICGHKARLRLINRRVITPSLAEVKFNPRSRSAKLRAAERIINQNEYNGTIETENLPPQLGTEGWRRPALLKKLRIAYSMQ